MLGLRSVSRSTRVQKFHKMTSEPHSQWPSSKNHSMNATLTYTHCKVNRSLDDLPPVVLTLIPASDHIVPASLGHSCPKATLPLPSSKGRFVWYSNWTTDSAFSLLSNKQSTIFKIAFMLKFLCNFTMVITWLWNYNKSFITVSFWIDQLVWFPLKIIFYYFIYFILLLTLKLRTNYEWILMTNFLKISILNFRQKTNDRSRGSTIPFQIFEHKNVNFRTIFLFQVPLAAII